ncbi:MAG: aspartyl/glutamyl-tRNA amidotransferase subunit C [Treponemataceae bacterium]
MIKDDLQATASLAHLDLTEAELASALPAFERMLTYFSAMREADTDEAAFGGPIADLEPTSHVFSAGNILRPDNNNNNPNYNPLHNNSNPADALLALAPELETRYLVVPNVL